MKHAILIMALALASIAGADTGSIWHDGTLLFQDSSTLEILYPVAANVLIEEWNRVGLDATNDWTTEAVNSGTIAVSAAIGGTVVLTTGAADDDDAELATELVWSPSKACCMTARVALGDIDKTALNVGFTDDKNEAADTLAMTYATATLTTTASDAALFFSDSDATSNLIRCAPVKNNTDGTVVSTGTAPVDGAYHVYTIFINTSGDVQFWFDGQHISTQLAAITTTDALCAYVGLINRETAANTATVDYIKVWQGR